MVTGSASRPLLTPREVADALGVSTLTLYRRRRDGTGPRFVRVGPRAIRYPREWVDAYLHENADLPHAA